MIGGNPWYDFCVGVVKLAYWFLGGVHSIGSENVPKTGPVLLAPNHFSHLDPPISVIGQRRHMNVMAKEELFRSKLFGRLIGSIGAFPVRRGANDIESIRRAIEFLEKGDGVLMFPEGTRGDGVRLLHMNKGISMLARRTGAMVVPVGINGTQHVFPKGGSKPRRQRMTIAYGKPFTFAEVAGEGNSTDQRDCFTRVLEERIIETCKIAGLSILPSEHETTDEERETSRETQP